MKRQEKRTFLIQSDDCIEIVPSLWEFADTDFAFSGSLACLANFQDYYIHILKVDYLGNVTLGLKQIGEDDPFTNTLKFNFAMSNQMSMLVTVGEAMFEILDTSKYHDSPFNDILVRQINIDGEICEENLLTPAVL